MEPAGTALAIGRQNDFLLVDQGRHRLYARQISQIPGKAIHLVHDIVIDTGILLRLNHDRQFIDTDGETLGNDLAVDIIAGILPQLGHARLGIADLQVVLFGKTPDGQYGDDTDNHQGRPRASEHGQGAPDNIAAFIGLLMFSAVFFDVVYFHIGQQHRQQHQIGQNDDGDPENRGDGHFLNNTNADQEHRQKPDHVTGQRDATRHQQASEGAPGGFHIVDAVGHGGRRDHRSTPGVGITAIHTLSHPATDHLHAVAYTDGEHQERHQDTHGIKPVTHQG